MHWREASVSTYSTHYLSKDFCSGHILLWSIKDSSCPEGGTGELFRNLPLPIQALLSKRDSLILSLQKVFAKPKQREDFFFPLFTLDPTKWLDRSTNLLHSWQVPITLANTLGCLLIRKSEEQNCRHQQQANTCTWDKGISQHIRCLLRQS